MTSAATGQSIGQSFDIEIYRTSAWCTVQAGLDRRMLGRAIDQHLGQKPRAMRVIQRTSRNPNGYQNAVMSHLWRGPGLDDAILDLPGYTGGHDIDWRNRRDMENPLCFYLLRQHFGVFLRSRAITVYDLLYDPRIAEELQSSWHIVQAAIQPIAHFQAAVMGGEVPALVRQLGQYFDGMYKETLRQAKANPVKPIEPKNLGITIAGIDQRRNDPDPHGHIIARICASLPAARAWQDRFIALINLLSDQPTPRELMYFDMYLAELVQIDGVALEPPQIEAGSAQIVTIIRDWVNGQMMDHRPERMAMWRRFNDLMRSGALPHTRDGLRHVMLRWLRRPDVQISPPDLVQAIVDIDVLGNDIDNGLSCWRGDAEIMDALDQQIMRLLNRENVQRMIIRHRQPTERLSAISSMFSILRRLQGRDKFAGLIEEFLVAPVLAKELEQELSGALPTLAPLLRFAQRLQRVDIDPESRARMFDGLDQVILDILDREILRDNARKDVDKALLVLRYWLPSPLFAGKSRDRVEEILTKAVVKPDFFNAFLESYKHEKVRQHAAEGLDALLIDMGLKQAPVA